MDAKTDIARARECFENENFARAKRLCERTLAVNGENAEAYFILGTIEMCRGRYAYAIPPLEKSLELAPDKADVMAQLAFSHQKERHVQKALETFKKALKIDPENFQALYGLGACQIPLGETIEARKHLEKAIQISKQAIEPYRLLADFTPKGKSKAFLKELEELEDEVKKTPVVEQVHWHHALASVYQKQGKLKKFEEHLKTASALQTPQDQKWLPVHKYMLKASEEEFAHQPFKLVTPLLEKKFTPIFIVGLPRSGSTMVEQILASHEKVYGADELVYARRFFVEDMTRHMSKPYPLFLNKLAKEDLVGMARRYQDTVKKLADGQPFITDKMVGNVFFVGIIKKVMPWAKVIHIKRHPYDMALSIYSHYFDVSTSFLNDLEELAEYFRCQCQALKLWQQVCPGFVHEVRYENLVTDLEGESRKMLEFCGLDWNPAVLEFHKAKRSVFTHSSTQVRKKVYTTSISKWKNHASMLEPFINSVKDLMEDYGYDPKAD